MRKIEEIFASIPNDLLIKKPPLSKEDQHSAVIIVEMLVNFLQDISAQFANIHKVTSDELIAVMSELIPANKAREIYLKAKLLDQFIKENTQGKFSLTNILAAATNKFDIVQNSEHSLANELNSLKIKEIDITTLPKVRKRIAADLAFFQKCELVLHKLDALYYPHKLERIAAIIAMFNKITISMPSYVLNYSSGLNDDEISASIDELKSNYLQALAILKPLIISMDADLELRKIVDECEWLCRKNISALCLAVAMQLPFIAIQMTQADYASLSLSYQSLLQFTNTLIQAENKIDVFHAVADKFSENYLIVLRLIRASSQLNATYYSKELLANQHSRSQFPTNTYKYILSGSDLYSSQNIFMQKQLKSNPDEYGNPNKYIIASDKDNLDKILKDGKSLLRYGNEEHKENDAERLRIYLMSKFNQSNTRDLIKFYSQSMPLMLSAAIHSPVNEDLSSPKNDDKNLSAKITVISPDEINQNLYLHDRILFREATCSNFKILVETKHALNAIWTFKVNLKIVSWLTPDGFVIENIGCDNALVSNFFKQQNCYNDLKYLVDTILQQEVNLSDKQRRLNKTIIGKKEHKEAIESAKNLLTSFKQGKLNFDELFTAVEKLLASSKNIGHFSLFGKAKGAIGSTPTGTFTVIKDLLEALKKLSDMLHKPVSRFDQSHSAQENKHTKMRLMANS